MTYPTIPEVVWASAPEELVHQHIMCVLCGPSEVPVKVFYIKGTSYCSTHTQTLVEAGAHL